MDVIEVEVKDKYVPGFVMSCRSAAQAEQLVEDHKNRLLVFMCKSTTCK